MWTLLIIDPFIFRAATCIYVEAGGHGRTNAKNKLYDDLLEFLKVDNSR